MTLTPMVTAALISSGTAAASAMYQKNTAVKPKEVIKTQDQLESEQDLKVSKFEAEAKTQNRAAAVESSLTRKSLLGNLGGSSSALGSTLSKSTNKGL